MIIFLFSDSLLNVDIKSLSSKTDILYGFLVFNNSIKPVDYSLLFEKSLYTLMNLFFYIRYNVITLPLSSLISYFDELYLFKSSWILYMLLVLFSLNQSMILMNLLVQGLSLAVMFLFLRKIMLIIYKIDLHLWRIRFEFTKVVFESLLGPRLWLFAFL